MTGIGAVFGLSFSLKLHSLCAAPRYLPVMWSWSLTESLKFGTRSGSAQNKHVSWLFAIHRSISSFGFLLSHGTYLFSAAWWKTHESIFYGFGRSICPNQDRTPPLNRNTGLWRGFCCKCGILSRSCVFAILLVSSPDAFCLPYLPAFPFRGSKAMWEVRRPRPFLYIWTARKSVRHSSWPSKKSRMAHAFPFWPWSFVYCLVRKCTSFSKHIQSLHKLRMGLSSVCSGS